jgi:hypothetical protein
MVFKPRRSKRRDDGGTEAVVHADAEDARDDAEVVIPDPFHEICSIATVGYDEDVRRLATCEFIMSKATLQAMEKKEHTSKTIDDSTATLAFATTATIKDALDSDLDTITDTTIGDHGTSLLDVATGTFQDMQETISNYVTLIQARAFGTQDSDLMHFALRYNKDAAVHTRQKSQLERGKVSRGVTGTFQEMHDTLSNYMTQMRRMQGSTRTQASTSTQDSTRSQDSTFPTNSHLFEI